MIRAGAVSFSYEGRQVLQMPEMIFQKGEVCALIGANGSGKTTYARLLSGCIRGQKKLLEDTLCVGYLPQKPYAFRIRVEKNIHLASSDQKRTDRMIRDLCLESMRKKRADKLSGGETARMALARILMRKYDLLILDEPTAAMDIEMTLRAEQVLREYRQETGCAVLLITHSLQQAGRSAERMLFLNRGRLVEEGKVEKLLQHPESELLKQYLLFH